MSKNNDIDNSKGRRVVSESSPGSFDNVDFLKQQLIQRENLAFIGQLTAGILHEIKNPLNFVNNFSRLTLDLIEELKEIEGKMDEDAVDDLIDITSSIKMNVTRILENGQRAERVILSMLAQAKENKPVELVPTNINQLVDEFMKLGYQGMRGQDKNFTLSIKTDYDPTLTTAMADPQDLSRVVLNLVSNACYTLNEKKKLSGDTFTPELSIVTKKDNSNFSISIKDNGMGMSDEVIDKIFNPFFTTKPNNEGTGLGLFISYNIITNNHKGSLEVDTKEGEGTNFIITIPLQ